MSGIDPGAFVGDFSLDESAEEVFYSAASDTTEIVGEAIGAGTAAAADTIAAGGGMAAATGAATTAVEATGITLSMVADCVTIAMAPIGILGTVLIPILLSVDEYISVNVVNDTPYNIYTSAQPQYDQWYVAHGKIVSFPNGVIPPYSSSNPTVATWYGSTYAFQNDSGSLIGPSGAFLIQLQDPNNGNLLGSLYVGYACPVTGDNALAVTFNYPGTVQDYYNYFNGQPAQQYTSAYLSAQTINGTSYPQVNANSGLSSLSGNPSGFVILSLAS
jgi:hypothetical protein